MMSQSEGQPVWVGIDVAKDELEIALRPNGERWVAEGHAELVGRLKRWKPPSLERIEHIVLEARGGYEKAVLAALGAAGLPVVAVHARPVRDFAKALGILAKTDRIAAQVLAPFAEVIRPALRPLPSAEAAQLQALELTPFGGHLNSMERKESTDAENETAVPG